MPEDGTNGYYNRYLEERFGRIESDIDKIMTNHLPHIQAAIDKLDVKMDENQEKNQRWLIATLTTAFLALLALSLNLFFLKK